MLSQRGQRTVRLPLPTAARIVPLLKPALIGAAVVGLGLRLGDGAIPAALSRVGPGTLLTAVALGALAVTATGLRWWMVALRLGLPLRASEAVSDTYRAVFLNSVLPGGVVGDVERAVRHGRGSVHGRGAHAVVIERAAGQAVGAGICLGLILTGPQLSLLIGAAAGLWPIAVILGGALAVTLTALLTVRTPRLFRLRVAALTVLARLAADLRLLSSSPLTGAGVLITSVAAQAGYLGTFLMAAEAAAVPLPVSSLLPLLALGLLAMGLPLSVGGWGPREAVLAASFAAAGLSSGDGFAVAVLYGLLSLVAALPGAAVPLLRRARSGAAVEAEGRPLC